MQMILIVGSIAMAVAFGGGWAARDAFCDAAAAKKEIVQLQTQIRAGQAAAAADAANAAAAQTTIDTLEGDIRELKISVGQCLGTDDVDELRKLWR